MKTRFDVLLIAATGAMLCLAGCAEPNLRTGEYRADQPGRDDFAAVYEDLIFVHVKSPENVPGTLAYWEWAGKYKVLDNGELSFDMDRETARRWHFSFQFLSNKQGILVNDLEQQSGFTLRYRTPKLKSSAAGPRPVGSRGVDPEYRYQDLSRSGD